MHGRTECGARGVTLCLLPGLTTGQRRAVIRRLRQEASRGFGPPLPLPQLAIAVVLDRVRTAARIAGAIVRLHPAVTLLPGAFMVAAMAMFVLVAAESPVGAPQLRAGLVEVTPAGGGWHALVPPLPANGQPACRLAACPVLPHTAQLPGPLDLAR